VSRAKAWNETRAAERLSAMLDQLAAQCPCGYDLAADGANWDRLDVALETARARRDLEAFAWASDAYLREGLRMFQAWRAAHARTVPDRDTPVAAYAEPPLDAWFDSLWEPLR